MKNIILILIICLLCYLIWGKICSNKELFDNTILNGTWSQIVNHNNNLIGIELIINNHGNVIINYTFYLGTTNKTTRTLHGSIKYSPNKIILNQVQNNNTYESLKENIIYNFNTRNNDIILTIESSSYTLSKK